MNYRLFFCIVYNTGYFDNNEKQRIRFNTVKIILDVVTSGVFISVLNKFFTGSFLGATQAINSVDDVVIAGNQIDDVANSAKQVASSADDVVIDAAHSIPKGQDLNMSQTVQNHINNIIKRGDNAGQFSRPYIDSKGTSLLLDEIMASGIPIKDAVLPYGLRWDVVGKFRGSVGTWELVVDTSNNIVYHFNFVSQ